MSFSYEVKEELARLASNPCCQRAELAALVRMAGSIKIAGGPGKATLQVQTEHASTARKVFKLLKKRVKSRVEVATSKNNFFKNHIMYIISVNLEEARDLLKDIGILSENEKRMSLKSSISPMLIKRRCCRRAYLRGAFLGGGSISDPKGPYHMEFVTTGKRHASALSRIISSFGLKAGLMERKNSHMVYLKDGNNIAELLGIMGAHNSLLKFEDIRVMKEMRNSVNRAVNCETANLNKTIEAALRQIKCIKFLKQQKLFDNLPPNLKQVAELRLKFPDLCLKELGQMMSPVLGKSGVSYRLKKIEDIAEKLLSMKGEKQHV
ncbi:MAG: cell division protein WhiA [Tepidanaerobacteraceae bacterium]|nr:cell division protein WhiA [Tepidanaerobacteraceae bacterium]